MMDCRHFDPYLDDELSPADRRAFESHLSQCDECARQFEAQSRFDRIVELASVKTPQLSRQTINRVKTRIRSRVNRSRIATAVITAVPVLLVSLGFAAIRINRDSAESTDATTAIARRDVREAVVPSSETDGDGPSRRPDVHVEMDEDSQYLAVPIESSNPDITIIWFHPTIDHRSFDKSSTTSDPYSSIARSS